MRYDIDFTPDSKIITFPLNKTGLTICILGFLIGFVNIFIGYEHDATFLILGGGFVSTVFLLAVIALITRHHRIILSKEEITLEQNEKLWKRSTYSVPVAQVKALFKERHIIKGKYGTRSDAYGLVVNYGANEELMLIRRSMDVKKVDEIKSIIKNYTGVPTRLTREG